MVGDRLLGEQEAVGAAHAAAQARGVERARERPRELRRVGHHGRGAVEPAHHRGEVAGVHERGDGEEGQVRVRQPDELERLARWDGLRAVAAVEHRAPAAAAQRGHQCVGAVGVLHPQPPPGLLHGTRDHPPVRGGHVHEQRTQGPERPHQDCIGCAASWL